MGLFDKQQPEPYKVADGLELQCLICNCELFWYRQTQLNTATAIELDWFNRSAICLVCDRCGYIHWFLPRN